MICQPVSVINDGFTKQKTVVGTSQVLSQNSKSSNEGTILET